MTTSDLLAENPREPSTAVTSAARLTGLARPLRLTVLAYHELASQSVAYQYTLSCPQFEDHLRLAARFRSITAPSQGQLVISFDDGHMSNYASALPLLEKYGCKAIFFVIVGRIGERKDFMTWRHLQELVSLGHRVEAHGWSHTFLTSCSDTDLDIEVGRSKRTLEDRLGAPVKALSAPHGRWNARVRRACEQAGYRELYTSNPWASRSDSRPVEVLGRLVVVQSMNADRLAHWLTMGAAEAAVQRTKQTLKDSARYLLGDKLYYQVWSRFSGWSGPDDYAQE